VDGTVVGTAVTDVNGIATLPYTITQNFGTYTILAEFLQDNSIHASSSNTNTLNVFDYTTPTVTSVDPVKNAVNVASNKVIKVTFSEPIKAGNMLIELKNSTGTILPITSIINGNILTINHLSPLTTGIWILTLKYGSLTDLAGNSITEYTSSFTVDSTSPTVKSVDPVNNAVNVAPNKVIKVTFSEPIKAGNMWIELKNSNGTTINITKTISGNNLTINHASTFPTGKYTLIIHSSSITDLTGNPISYYSYIFNVDITPPKVSSTVPANMKTGISRWASMVIKFNENIKTSTYYNSITVKNLSTNKYVTINKALSGNTLIIKTSTTKTVNTWYQVTIPKSAIKDYAGNNLTANYTFRFKTGP
jgi:methionine-rich copper-binding protein CopC